jgi:hypothetical protein
VTAQSVFTMLGPPNAPSGGTISGIKRLFPDLVDITHKEVYEIMPMTIAGTTAGAVQLGSYDLALNKLDPAGGWEVAIGSHHYNSPQTFMIPKPLAFVIVMSPVFGIIYYEAITPAQFAAKPAKTVTTANTARLQQHMGIAVILGVMGKI